MRLSSLYIAVGAIGAVLGFGYTFGQIFTNVGNPSKQKLNQISVSEEVQEYANIEQEFLELGKLKPVDKNILYKRIDLEERLEDLENKPEVTEEINNIMKLYEESENTFSRNYARNLSFGFLYSVIFCGGLFGRFEADRKNRERKYESLS